MGACQCLRIFNRTKSPVRSLMTISRHPGASVATNALPHAAASRRLIGKPSRCEGQNGEMTASPKRDDIIDVPEPGDSWPLAPFLSFL